MAGLIFAAGCGGSEPTAGQAEATSEAPFHTDAPEDTDGTSAAAEDPPETANDGPVAPANPDEPLDPCALITTQDIQELTGADLPDHGTGLDGSVIDYSINPSRYCNNTDGTTVVDVRAELFPTSEESLQDLDYVRDLWSDLEPVAVNLGDGGVMVTDDVPFIQVTLGRDSIYINHNVAVSDAEASLTALAELALARAAEMR